MSKQSSPSTTLHYHKDYQSQPRSNRESLVNTARFKTPVDGTDEGDLGTVQPNMQETTTSSSEIRLSMKLADVAISAASRVSEVDRTSLISYPKSAMTHHSINSTINDSSLPIWKHPRLKKHPNTVAAALCLTLVGTIFFCVSMYGFALNLATIGPVFIVLAIVTGLPGLYQTIYIYRALKGKPGYHFSNIPSFE